MKNKKKIKVGEEMSSTILNTAKLMNQETKVVVAEDDQPCVEQANKKSKVDEVFVLEESTVAVNNKNFQKFVENGEELMLISIMANATTTNYWIPKRRIQEAVNVDFLLSGTSTVSCVCIDNMVSRMVLETLMDVLKQFGFQFLDETMYTQCKHVQDFTDRTVVVLVLEQDK